MARRSGSNDMSDNADEGKALGDADRRIAELRNRIAALRKRAGSEQKTTVSRKHVSPKPGDELLSRALLKTLLEEMPVAFAFLDLELRYVLVNDRLAEINGLPASDHIGRRVGDVVPALAPMAEQVVERILSTGMAVTDHEFCGETASMPGVRRCWCEGWYPVRGDADEIIGFAAMVEEITGLRKAENVSRECEKRSRQRAEELETLMDIIPAAIWVSHDPDCAVITGNRLANLFTESSPGENISAGSASGENYDRPRRFFVNGRELRPDELPMQAATARGTDVLNSEIDVQLPSGRHMFVLGSARPLRDADGSIRGCVSAFVDITERKRVELELEKTRGRLEDLVRERTRKLEDAKAQAELYLDLMGHDINNLHQIALGYLELASETEAGETQRELVGKSMDVLKRSTGLIQNVRKLQKHHDGLFSSQDVDVCRVLRDVHREFGAVTGKTVKLDLAGCGLYYVRANELLHDVFANLVSNAIKHTGDWADIGVRLDIVDDGGVRYCRVGVEDDGPGIPDHLKARIFDRRLKSDSRAKGMGLGLYLVKSLVESYGGRVWVEDRVAGDQTKGARFVVLLSLVEN